MDISVKDKFKLIQGNGERFSNEDFAEQIKKDMNKFGIPVENVTIFGPEELVRRIFFPGKPPNLKIVKGDKDECDIETGE